MRRFSIILLLPMTLTGCLSPGTTSKSWSCRAVGNESCAAISSIDQGGAQTDKASPRPIFGARPAAWWEASPPLAVTRSDAPRRETDQTMRIVVAPYIDGQGDYHDRSEVYAVMRTAQWWFAPPVPVKASPVPGSPLKPPESSSPADGGE